MSKEQTVYLKGWAVLFMMFLHYRGRVGMVDISIY